jgi:hypothetical protein
MKCRHLVKKEVMFYKDQYSCITIAEIKDIKNRTTYDIGIGTRE